MEFIQWPQIQILVLFRNPVFRPSGYFSIFLGLSGLSGPFWIGVYFPRNWILEHFSPRSPFINILYRQHSDPLILPKNIREEDLSIRVLGVQESLPKNNSSRNRHPDLFSSL